MFALRILIWRLYKRLLRKPWALALGVVLLAIDIVLLDEPNTPLLLVAIFTILKGGYDVVEPAIKDQRELRQLYRVKRSTGSIQHPYEGPEYDDWQSITRDNEHAIHDPSLDLKLRSNERIELEINERIWTPTIEAYDDARKLLSLKLDFDEVKIRPRDDILATTTKVTLQRTRYSGSLVTNNLGYWEYRRQNEVSPALHFEQIGLPAGRIARFTRDNLSNHLGADVILVTEGSIILQRNSENNLVNAGMIVPSGSGSADWADLDGQDDLGSVIKQTMRRELHEELGLRGDDQLRDEDIRIIGYARLRQMGGKPQFYGIARTRQVEVRIKSSERRYVADHFRIDFDAARGVSTLTETLDGILVTYEKDLSFALYTNIHLLKAWIESDADDAADWLGLP